MFLDSSDHGSILRLYIQPGASKNQWVGPFGNPPRLKIKIHAPPVEGEANDELIHFMQKFFELKKTDIQIKRGDKSRQKDVWLNLSPHEIQEKFISNGFDFF